MASQKPWHRKFTASFIPTVSLAVAVIFIPPSTPAHADCEDGVAAVDSAMQDAINHLSAAEDLLEEALSGVDQATSTDQQTCSFLSGSQERYLAARNGFERCIVALDETLANCSSPDWSALTASPQHCQTNLDAVNTQLTTLPEDIARFCGE